MNLPRLSRSLVAPAQVPERILQFGGGNFLRAFVGELVERANAKGHALGRIVIVQSISRDRGAAVAEQDGLCTVVTRGMEAGNVIDRALVVTCVSRALAAHDRADWDAVLALATSPDLRVIVSNTTEAGIAFDGQSRPSSNVAAASFPGKLCQVLYARWMALGADAPGLAILPCELIEENGRALRTAVLAAAHAWGLSPEFAGWLVRANAFCDTLVDRIVPGAPKAEDATELAARLGYDDRLLTVAEPYHLWAIRAPAWVRKLLPLDTVGNVVWTDDLPAYRVRKVRVLNGAHTAMAVIGRLAGLATVGEVMADADVGGAIVRLLREEVVPTLSEDGGYVDQVLDRFRNPFVRHELAAISLNTTAKWRVRLLPTLVDQCAAGRPAPRIVLSLAAVIAVYRGSTVPVQDEPAVLAAWNEHDANAVDAILGDMRLWGRDLRPLGVAPAVATALAAIRQHGIRSLVKELA